VTTEILEISKDRICDSSRLRAAELQNTQLKTRELHIMEIDRELLATEEYAEAYQYYSSTNILQSTYGTDRAMRIAMVFFHRRERSRAPASRGARHHLRPSLGPKVTRGSRQQDICALRWRMRLARAQGVDAQGTVLLRRTVYGTRFCAGSSDQVLSHPVEGTSRVPGSSGVSLDRDVWVYAFAADRLHALPRYQRGLDQPQTQGACMPRSSSQSGKPSTAADQGGFRHRVISRPQRASQPRPFRGPRDHQNHIPSFGSERGEDQGLGLPLLSPRLERR
jgi:hypothetical protein